MNIPEFDCITRFWEFVGSAMISPPLVLPLVSEWDEQGLLGQSPARLFGGHHNRLYVTWVKLLAPSGVINFGWQAERIHIHVTISFLMQMSVANYHIWCIYGYTYFKLLPKIIHLQVSTFLKLFLVLEARCVLFLKYLIIYQWCIDWSQTHSAVYCVSSHNHLTPLW